MICPGCKKEFKRLNAHSHACPAMHHLSALPICGPVVLTRAEIVDLIGNLTIYRDTWGLTEDQRSSFSIVISELVAKANRTMLDNGFTAISEICADFS